MTNLTPSPDAGSVLLGPVLDAHGQGLSQPVAARSYGRAEEFLGHWLADRGHCDAVVGSKWGYRYTGDWRLDADRLDSDRLDTDQQEVKEHSLAMFTTQLAQTRARLGDRLALKCAACSAG